MESMEKEKETMSENLKRVELEAQTLREATDERIQSAENAAKEKLAFRAESFRRGNGTVCRRTSEFRGIG